MWNYLFLKAQRLLIFWYIYEMNPNPYMSRQNSSTLCYTVMWKEFIFYKEKHELLCILHFRGKNQNAFGTEKLAQNHHN